MNKSANYQDYLIQSLTDPEEAAGYLNAALEGGNIDVFLLALKNVIQAQGSIPELAKNLQKSRTSLYKTLSADGNPYFKSTHELLDAVGMQITITPKSANKQPNK